MSHFHYYTKQEILEQTTLRKYESKLGEHVQVLNSVHDAVSGEQSFDFNIPGKYVCFGIPESIGIMGNHGTKGAENTWFHFIRAFLNMQSTDLCKGDDIVLAGYFDFSSISKIIEEHSFSSDERIDACRHAVANIIDEEVEEFVKQIISAGKIPIVIGGGHNNAYPLIKGVAKSYHKSGLISKPSINAINLDSSAEYRIMEGRHSGNAFRYAMEEGYLSKYAIVGLQENVNPQSMMDDVYSNVNIVYYSYENIYVEEKLNFMQSLAQSFSFVDEGPIALELDLDAISHIPSSGQNPSGITVAEARQYIRFAGNYPTIASLHICEGAADHLHSDSSQLGRLISFLITDFIKAKA